jgi:hypothetical protein
MALLNGFHPDLATLVRIVDARRIGEDRRNHDAGLLCSVSVAGSASE